jgi:hypothetical protein
MRVVAAFVSSILVAVAGCGGGGGGGVAPAPPPSGSTERDVAPATVDTNVTTATEPHVAITPSGAAAGKLFVFLPGTKGHPSYYRLILRSGAARGYHGIGINYPNPRSVDDVCGSSADSCFWDVRREVVTGADESALVDVGTADAIVPRLERALAYLNSTYPDEGWGQYLSGASVEWSKVVVAGHSQGGGHAGVMAKLYAMDRAVYFASPADSIGGQPVAWMSFANRTPASQQFGFGNTRDSLVPYNVLQRNWAALGLAGFGSPASVDGQSVGAFGSTRLLTTSVDGETNGVVFSPTHGSTVIDGATPLDAEGKPLFDAVWGYLCFP